MAERPKNKASIAAILRSKWFLTVLVPLIFFAYLFSVDLNMNLNDPDLFWHIKTGDYILKNWEVPDVDPFAYTTPRPLTTAQKIGLRSQWLGQVIFYMAYAAGDFWGIGVFRNLLIILPMAIIYLWLIRRGLGVWTALGITSLPTAFFCFELFYSFERPQGLSFSIALLVIILLERVRRKSKEKGFDISYALLPLATALWSNIHAGFIVGNIIILIYFGAELLRLAYSKIRRSGTQTNGAMFYAVCVLALVASSFNPNSYVLFLSYFRGLFSMFMTDLHRTVTGEGGSWVREIVLEYKPLYYFYSYLGYKWLMFYWIFSGLLYVCMIAKYIIRRSFDLAEFASVTLVVLFANFYARGLMFSLTIMPLYMGKTVLELKDAEVKLKNLYKVVAAGVISISIGFLTYTYINSPYIFKPGVTDEWVTPWYPTRLSAFLETANIKPPMYNYYTWGGYLIWRLYPQYQVFIDGRAIDDWVSRTADDMLKAHPGWEKQLEAYNINFIAIPGIFRESGHMIPLAAELAYDDRWKLVFAFNNGFVFVRDTAENKEIIYRYNMDKSNVFVEVLNVTNLLLSTAPNNPIYNMTKADALLALGDIQTAKALYDRFPEEARMRQHSIGYLSKLRPLKDMQTHQWIMQQ